MEADWNEAIRITVAGPGPDAPPSQLTAFAFDPSQELLWTGDDHGRVTSFYGAELQRYTSYRAHSAPRGLPGDVPVQQFLFCERGVISLSTQSVHLSSRRGLTQWHLADVGMSDLRCMSFTSRDQAEIVVAGCQASMFRIDVDKGSISAVRAPSDTLTPFTLMRLAGQAICAAGLDGSIYLLDPKTLSVTHTWKAYAGAVNDMDARGDYLLTCGWAQMQHQGLGLERLVRVYNLKTQQPSPPVPFLSGAAFVRLHPKLSSTCIVVSQTGVIHSIDIQNPDAPVMRFANAFDVHLTGLELMPSGRGLILADSNCDLALWASPMKLQYTEFSGPAEFADTHVDDSKPLEWSCEAPLNMVGMPFYREALLSGWPNSLLHEVGLPPRRMEPPSRQTFRPFEYGLVGPNQRNGRRYEVENTRSRKKPSNPLAAPKFLSERPRDEDLPHVTERRLSEDIGKVFNSLQLDGGLAPDPKFLYRVVEIKYSRFGVEDFDFRYYNKTRYAGLETHIVNSYANPLLQVFRFTNMVRNLALHHTAQDCQTEECLLCELGFLIDMLEKARGPNCQANNFCKALSRQIDAPSQNILEDHTLATPLTAMVQNLNRFLLLRLEENFKWMAPSLDAFHLTFGTIGLDKTKCLQCGFESRADKVWYTHDLQYPPKTAKNNMSRGLRHEFSQLLRNSIEKYNQHRGWCLKCNGYKPMSSQRAIHCLPAVLTLNAAVTGAEARQMWSTPNFLPQEVGIIVNNGRFYCYEGPEIQLHIQRGQYNITVYELVGVVADVKTSDSEKSHLVATINAGLVDPDPNRGSDWHLFNDFLVHRIPAKEALHFDSQWKLPSVITYQIKQASHQVDNSWKNAMDTSILFRSPAQPAISCDYQFRSLSEAEALPDHTSHCAIDAEFVRLLREEIDLGADGTRTMTRPARSGLARVSVLRGDGHDQELPFIDDYIAIDERIDDYLTQYSGLQDGDLTPGRSRFVLVGLKEVYKKLWVLLNRRVSFIGHGLSSDFRIINIHVPEAQVIDTQELFSLGSRGRRKLSLRFLAWILLGEDIQTNVDAGHDSIEDARTALKLWRKYLEFQEAGIFEQKMDEVFAKGRATDFKVPYSGDGRRTPPASHPGTPSTQSARLATPARSEFGSPQKRSGFGLMSP